MEFDDDLKAGVGSLWEPDEPRAVVRRVWCGLAIVGVTMFVVALAVFERRDAVGVAIGAGLISLSFWFLQSSMRSLLLAGDEKAPSGTVFSFVVRWFLVGAIGYMVYRAGLASGGGLLTGTFALLGAILFEALFQAVSAIRRHGDRSSSKDN
jgi:hypothetical protein